VFTILQMKIQSTYPAIFIKITDVVQQIQQFKLFSSLLQVNKQSHPEYSAITNQTLHNFFANIANVLVMNVSCPLVI